MVKKGNAFDLNQGTDVHTFNMSFTKFGLINQCGIQQIVVTVYRMYVYVALTRSLQRTYKVGSKAGKTHASNSCSQ